MPNTNTNKADLQKWLQEHNISFPEDGFKHQLLMLVAENKPPKTYITDELAMQYGHFVLRVPPYHCNFNAIEHVWGIPKTYYTRHIGTITPDILAYCIKHVETEIAAWWWKREVGFDRENVAPLIIQVNSESDESTSEDND